MMAHGWSPEMWIVYTLVNWVIAIAFIAIPIGLRLRRDPEQPRGRTLTLLFEAFILACGAHHFVHPIAMYALGPEMMFVVLVVVDTICASVSVYTAVVMGTGTFDDG